MIIRTMFADCWQLWVGEPYVFERGFYVQRQLEESVRLCKVLLHEPGRHSGVPDVKEAIFPARHQQ